MIPKELKIPCLGYEVIADWYESSKDKILLVLIGYTSSKQSANELVSHIVKNTGYSALVLEYSGYEGSQFDLEEVSMAQNFLEVVKVFDWISEKYLKAKISVMGTSYGGYLGALLMQYRTIKNLILRVPAIYLPEDFYTSNKHINADEIYLYRQNTIKLSSHPVFNEAQNFKGHTLVVVHEHDEFIPKNVTDKYIKAFNADSYLAKGFTHSFKVDAPEDQKTAYRSAISDWINLHS